MESSISIHGKEPSYPAQDGIVHALRKECNVVRSYFATICLRSLYCHNHSDIDQLIDWYLSDRGDYDLEHDHILQRLSIVIDSMEMSSQLALLWMLDACRKHHHTSWLVNVLRMVPFDLGWLPPCTSLHCPACQSTPNAVQP